MEYPEAFQQHVLLGSTMIESAAKPTAA